MPLGREFKGLSLAMRTKLFAARCSLGRLQRIDANFYNRYFGFGVGREITDAQSPFRTRIHIGVAKLPSLCLDDALAPFALLDNREKRPIVELSYIACLHIANS